MFRMYSLLNYYTRMLPRLLLAISGCVWAGIAWVLLDRPQIHIALGGAILASPLIGIFIGSFSRAFPERSILKRVGIALLTLYFAAALFGAAGGVADFVVSLGAGVLRFPISIVETAFAFVWGLTFTGYFLVLWPLAYLNHSYIARACSNPKRYNHLISPLSKLIVILLAILMFSKDAIGQNPKSVDLRSQIQPNAEEQVDAVRYSDVRGELPGPETSLIVTIRFIGPVSDSKGIGTAEVEFQNTGKGSFRFPVSLEMKLLHTQGSSDRRALLCSFELSDSNGPLTRITAFHTFTSSLDNTSWVQLRPKETLIMTFNADFRLLFADPNQWKERIRSETLEAGIQCTQTTLHPVPGKELDRVYSSDLATFGSTNKVRLGLNP